MRELIKQYSVRLSLFIIRLLLKKGILRLFVRLLVNDKNLLHSFIELFVDKTDLVCHAQRMSEKKKFFCVDQSRIEQVLEGDKLSVFDVGAAGSIERGLKRYRHLLNVIAAEPRNDNSLIENSEDFILIPKLIGKTEGRATLFITRSETGSSIHQPIGVFLNFHSSGNTGRFDCIKQVEYPIATIAAVLKETSREVHYLKLDTQGNELDILEGLGEYRPIIIKTEISFVPLYKDQAIFFHLAKYLYDMGYVLFHLAYRSRRSPNKTGEIFRETVIPIHGDAWFMPDWTREKGRKIIGGREKEYKALMLIFGLGEICEYALEQTKVSNNHND
jgi:FkbM family methyltransferase